MVNAVGLVLHPGRDCSPAMLEITDWAVRRNAEVLGLADEIRRITGRAVAVEERDLAQRADLLVSLGATEPCSGLYVLLAAKPLRSSA